MTETLYYRDADKSLARPTSDVFCLMVRIFLLMLLTYLLTYLLHGAESFLRS